MMNGSLKELREQEKKDFDAYVDKMAADELTPEDVNPIKYEDSPYHTFEMGNMSALSFSTADDPFYKAPVSKYYPEAIVMDSHGEVIARVGPNCREFQ